MNPARTRMPAEWERHAATWIAWPHNPDDWPGKFQPIPWVYAEIVRHLSRVEAVHILVNDQAAERRAAGILKRGGADLARIRFHRWPTDRVWLRDSGPIFVKAEGSVKVEQAAEKVGFRAESGEKRVPGAKALTGSAPLLPGLKPRPISEASFSAVSEYPMKETGGDGDGEDLAVTNWKFNAWAKYDNWRRDDQIPHRVARLYNIPEIRPEAELDDGRRRRIVLEGGSIDTNGAGILLTTEECLLSEVQQRNPGLGDETSTMRFLERAFHDHLGIDQTLWLNRGCAGDDTHGHIDDIARFVAEDTILACVEPNSADDNHLPLTENLDRLRGFRQARGPSRGKPFNIVELPMPAPVVFAGQRLPASYANFYIANGLVLVPTFNDPNDRRALNIIAECFRSREVVGIHSIDLVWGLGTLHCLTQQEPA